MKLTALAVGAAMLFSPFAVAATPPQTPIPEPISSVVHLLDKNGNGFCSGFHIGGGIVVSAGHCASVQPASVKLSNGEVRLVATAAFGDPQLGMPDFLILKVGTGANGMEVDELDCSGSRLPVGMEIRSTGYPGILGLITVWGRIASDKATPISEAGWDHPVIRVDLAIRGGASGAPLYNEATGKVVGIVVGADPANRSLALVTPIGVVCRMVTV